MKQRAVILLFILLALNCNAKIKPQSSPHLTVSPLIDQNSSVNQPIISALEEFLKTKNDSPSHNEFWLETDFVRYKFPYLDIYNIENSKYGADFFKPTLMEILPCDNDYQKIVKLAFIGHNAETGDNFVKAIYNLVANQQDNKIFFSRYLDVATQHWQTKKIGSISYVISPNKRVNDLDILKQSEEILSLCQFFKSKPIAITYYSCVNPKELFEIKGFDYAPMMYVDKTGGLSDYGNIVFSGNNSEIYTHEIIHIYTNTLFPKISKFLDEGIATYIAGSGKFDYEWHRKKLAKFLSENPSYDFTEHLDPYERLYFETETSIPYLTAALICERTKRIYGNEALLRSLESGNEFWVTVEKVGLTKGNFNASLKAELSQTLTKPF